MSVTAAHPTETTGRDQSHLIPWTCHTCHTPLDRTGSIGVPLAAVKAAADGDTKPIYWRAWCPHHPPAPSANQWRTYSVRRVRTCAKVDALTRHLYATGAGYWMAYTNWAEFTGCGATR